MNNNNNAVDVFGEHLKEYKRLSDAVTVLRDRQEELNPESEMYKAIDLGVLAIVRLCDLHQTNPELDWLLD